MGIEPTIRSQFAIAHNILPSSTSELASAVELILLLRIMHLRVEVNLRHFKGFMAEPTLDLHQIEARAQPIRRRGFPKPVEVMFLAHRLLVAGRFDGVAVV